MLSVISSILGVVGQGIKGFFGIREKQAHVIDSALEILGDVNKSDDARAIAAAQIISAEARSESWITRTWRPMVVLIFVSLLVSHLLGYTAQGLTEKVIMRIFDIVEYATLGYMGMRSADKWIREFQLGSILSKFLERKLT